LAAGLTHAGLLPRLENGHGSSRANGVEQVSGDDTRRPSVCAVFVGAGGLDEWEPGTIGLALRGADPGHAQRLIPVLLPGAPDPLTAAALPPGLATQPWVDLRAAAEGPEAIQRLAAAIRGLTPPTPLDAPELRGAMVCPYRGLEVFEEQHTGLFFGRDADIQRVLEQLKAARFLAVVAPSGSGKSSLVRAGLLPALRAGALPASATWTRGVLTPGPEPLAALAAAVVQAASKGAMQPTLDRLADDARTLHLATELALAGRPRAARLVLVVDQFEELFTQCWDEQEGAQFVANLLYAATVPQGRTVVVLTMRADFYARCTAYPELAACIVAHQHLLGPMDENGMRQAIEWPAHRTGLTFEPGLVDTILDDVAGEPGALPLLEYGLMQVWDRRQGSWLTFEGYRSSGGILGALTQRAEQIYAAFSPDERAISQRLFLRLVEPGEGTEDSRRRATLAELITPTSGHEATERVLQALTDARLVSTSGDSRTGESWVELAHEALVQNWPRLRTWLDENRAALRVHRRLMEGAREWHRLGREDDALLRGARLAEAVDWREEHEAELNEVEREFVDASVALRDRERLARGRRRRLIFAALTIGLLVALGLSGIAVAQWRQAAAQRSVAVARELAFEADAALKGSGVVLPRSALLAAEALRQFPSRDTEPALRQGLALLARPILHLGHAARVNGVAYSPDGRYLLTGDSSGMAHVWETETGLELNRLPHEKAVRAVAWSPDQKYVATASDDQTATIWDVETGRVITRLQHSSPVYALAISGDGRHSATATTDGGLHVWDTDTWRPQIDVSGGVPVVEQFSPDGGNEFAESLAQSIAFSPDGSDLVAGRFADGAARIWDVETGVEISELWHGGPVLSVTFSPDGQYVATGSGDGGVRIWNPKTGQEAGRFIIGNSSPVFAAVFSPDGRYLATGGFGYATYVLTVPDTTEVVRLPSEDSIQSLAWSPGGTSVAAASNDGTARIWDVASGQEVARAAIGTGLAGDVLYGVAFSPDGTQLVTASSDQRVRTWEATKPWQTRGLAHDAEIVGVVFSSDGRYLASTSGNVAHIWDASTGREVQRLVHPARAWQLNFSGNAKYLATSSFDGNARIWDVASGQEVARFHHGDNERVYGVHFSPDGRYLATAGVLGGVRVWDIASGEVIMTGAHDGAAGYLRFTPDSRFLISGSVDHTARVWDISTGAEVRRLVADYPLYELDISPDGRYLAGGDDRGARVWDLETGRQTLSLPNDTTVFGVAFSPDGSLLATGSRNGIARVFNVKTGRQVAGMAHDQALGAVAFSPDGHYVATTDVDQTIRVWRAVLDDPVGEACAVVIRNLTPDEWQQALPDEAYHKTCPNLP
jgi:WD40 repeat protein